MSLNDKSQHNGTRARRPRCGLMRIRVQREDGSVETISVADMVVVQPGKVLNRLVTASGAEHFFTHDGYYDGWGAAVQTEEAGASAVLDAMESKRTLSQD